MPMKNISTRCVIKLTENGKNKDSRLMPCRVTMDFLTQFARGYHIEPVIPKDLCAFMLN
jgi:hypothetical protein